MIKNLPANAGGARAVGSIPGSGRSLEEEMATLENSLDSGAWKATVHGVAESQT